jgi:hypothetical protein
MRSVEKRKYKRLPIKLDLCCHRTGSVAKEVYTGCTVDVSAGGLFFETAADVFKTGNMLTVELSIPPTVGLLEFGGSVSGLGKVVRTHTICDSTTGTDLTSARSGIALEFCQPLSFST